MIQKTILEIIEEEGTIFQNREVFSLDYIPENYKFRDVQLKRMAVYSKDIKEGKAPTNLLLTGTYGTGKTTTLKKFFELIEKKYPYVKTAHVNCGIHRTEYIVLTKIYKELFGKSHKIDGLSSFSIYEAIIKKIVNDDYILIIALDDYNFLKISNEFNKLLHTMLRAGETSRREYKLKEAPQIGIFIISSQSQNILLNRNIAPVFHPVTINFPNYQLHQIHYILNERAKIGFYEGTVNETIIKEVSKKTYEAGDLRFGIDLLLKIGIIAEQEGSYEIELKHLDKYFKTINKMKKGLKLI